MLRSRIIPSLLIDNDELVKTVCFDNPKYVGDPINAVRIFNEKKVDELMIFDISVTREKKKINFNLLKDIASEARMPLCYGGGVTSAEDAKKIISIGFEKVSISSAFFKNKEIILEIANLVGVQSLVLTLDIKKIDNKFFIFTNSGKDQVNEDLKQILTDLNNFNIGELVVNSINGDGTLAGFDMELASFIRSYIKSPVTFLGGIGSTRDMTDLISRIGIVGIGVGSFFLFNGPFRAVLISYKKP